MSPDQVRRRFQNANHRSRWQVTFGPLTPAEQQTWLERRATARSKPWPTAPGPAAAAYVNHSRWVADCPSCRAAMWLNEHQTEFVCGECFDTTRPIEWPADADTAVGLLERRPDPATRNWRAPETPADLERQNRERR